MLCVFLAHVFDGKSSTTRVKEIDRVLCSHSQGVWRAG
jgi:hypothetical protein